MLGRLPFELIPLGFHSGFVLPSLRLELTSLCVEDLAMLPGLPIKLVPLGF